MYYTNSMIFKVEIIHVTQILYFKSNILIHCTKKYTNFFSGAIWDHGTYVQT